MFRETDNHSQLDLFSAPENLLHGRSLSFYQDESGWHNVFRKEVLMRLDESPFRILFCQDNGAPNASVRILVCMMILKECQGWSDSQLYEQCRFNILIRSSLGLFNVHDPVPTESTYYLFRKRMVEHERQTGENLLEKAFAQITRDQVREFNVSGKQVRMDSKLLGSNIAWYSRYELIHETVYLFYKNREAYILKRNLGKSDMELLNSLTEEKGDKVVYRLPRAEVRARMQKLGILTYRLLAMFKKYPGDDYTTLQRVFNEQFYISKQKEIIPLEKEEIKAQSLQSPHDPDCTYRNKDGNQVKGYAINVTETCDQGKNKLNLITDIQVDTVTTADSSFLTPAVENTQEILTGSIEKLYVDGAYHSPDNQALCAQEGIEFITANMQGPEAKYDISLQEDTGELIVIDRQTQEVVPAKRVIPKKDKNIIKWRIKTADKKYRYFTEKDIETSLQRQKIRQTPRDQLNIRNNVEATIFQLAYHYPNDKSRYRTLCKHKMWANLRAIGINFRRILIFTKQTCQRTNGFSKSGLISIIEDQILMFKYTMKQIFINNSPHCPILPVYPISK